MYTYHKNGTSKLKFLHVTVYITSKMLKRFSPIKGENLLKLKIKAASHGVILSLLSDFETHSVIGQTTSAPASHLNQQPLEVEILKSKNAISDGSVIYFYYLNFMWFNMSHW